MGKNKETNTKLNEKKRKTYRNYETADLVSAAKKVKAGEATVYKASKDYGVPYNSLKDFLSKNDDLDHVQPLKMGRPFALTSDIELRVFNFIIDMQELGFGLTVVQIRKLAYDLAEKVGRERFFNVETKIASKWWWGKFKERYNLCLRVPENLSRYRASMANPVIVQDYFLKLDQLLTQLGIKNQPNRIWNVDETGLSYVVKPNKIVSQVGKKYIYKRTYAERGQLQTVVCCACADGTFIPPMVIFKGVRWSDQLKEGSLPNSLVRLSPKGWINADLFLDWFKFFIEAISPVRPVVLLMDSHGSHVGPEVIELAKKNKVYLMTFPAHTSHILQPLDVGVYKSLKSSWAKILNNHMIQHPNNMPSRTHFHELFTPAFLDSFTPLNIINSFKKAGACPYNRNIVPSEALAPSKLTDSDRVSSLATPSRTQSLSSGLGQLTPTVSTSNTSEDQLQGIDDLLQVPYAPKRSTDNHANTSTKATKKRKPQTNKQHKTVDSSATCLNPPGKNKVPLDTFTIQPGPSRPTTSTRATLSDEDWKCGVCSKCFSEDVKMKNGAKWLQCSFCQYPYHEKCQSNPTKELIFMCDACEPLYGNEDSD